MSRIMQRVRGLWSRLPKSVALIAAGVLVAASAVGIGTSSKALADTAPWVPQSTVTLTASDCYSGGTNVAGLISSSNNIAPGEEITSLIFNGAPVGDFGPMISAAGTYPYSYVIKNLDTGETATSPEKTVTVEACTVTPPDPPATPDPTTQTVYGDWTGPQPSCDALSVTQTRTVSTITTTYTWEWNSSTNQYDKISHEGQSVPGQPETRTLTYDGTCTMPEPASPTATAKCDHCSDANAANGTATVTVTNTADDTKADATYEVTLNGVTESITLADGKSGGVNFSGLAPGTYDVTVKGNDDTSATATVTIDKCDVTPPVPDFPAAPKVCGPNYTLPADTADFTWMIIREGANVGHVVATRVVDGATHDYGKVPLGGDCPTSPANPGDGGTPPGGGTTPPTDGGTTPPVTTPVDTQQAAPVDAVTRTPEAPVTGGVGKTGVEGYLWGVLALAGLIVGGAAAFGLRRRHA